MPERRPSTAARLHAVIGDAWPLAALAAAIALLLAGLDTVTGDRIAHNEKVRLRQMLAAMMELDASADPLRGLELASPLPAAFTICTLHPGETAGNGAARRERYHFVAAAARGYGGPIHYLASAADDGRLLAIRIVGHSETPGLGDLIEPRRSDWLAQFTGNRPDPDDPDWALDVDGGRFDALSGATITARAMVRALGASGARLTGIPPQDCDHVVDVR